MVVECPSCKTKFSVDSDLLQGVSNPRFHCSRCDHFFEGAATLEEQEEIPQAFDQGRRATVQTSFDTTPSYSQNPPNISGRAAIVPGSTSGLQASGDKDFSSGQSSPVMAPTVGSLSVDPVHEASTLGYFDSSSEPSWAMGNLDAWSTSDSESSRGESSSVASNSSFEFPPIQPPAFAQTDFTSTIQALSDRGFDEKNSKSHLLGKDQIHLPVEYEGKIDSPPISPQLFLDDLEKDIEGPEDIASSKGVIIPWPSSGRGTPVETDLSRLSDRGKAFRSKSAQEDEEDTSWTSAPWRGGPTVNEDEIPEEQDEKFSTKERQGFLGHSSASLASAHPFVARQHFGPHVGKGVHPAFLLVAPAIFLTALSFLVILHPNSKSLFGEALKSLPTIMPKVVSRTYGGVQTSWKAAPASVSVRNTAGKFITLEDGTRVYEIRGNVFNESEHPLKDIMLQGKVYNADGVELKNILVPAANQLKGSRVENLSGKALQNLGIKPAYKQESLPPGKGLSFRLIFPSIPSNASDFGVRVYSIVREDSV